MPATTDNAPAFKEKDLGRWRLIERFRQALAAEVSGRGGPAGSWADPKRQLQLEEYLSLFLFGMFNPVVETMRGLCASSRLGRVQREVCGRKVSLGSFSEAQAVVEPEVLKGVLERLGADAASPGVRPGLSGRERVIDSTVWRVLPRMSWAFWRRQGGLDNAVRLHVAFDLAKGRVGDSRLTVAKVCERAQWRELARSGTCDIADRYYGYDYTRLGELQAAGTDFVVRLRVDAQWTDGANPRRGGKHPDRDHAVRAGHPARDDRAVLQAPLASGDVFSLAQMHPGLPALAGRERTGRGPASLSGAHRRPIAGAVSRRTAQPPANGSDPVLPDGLGQPGRTHGRLAAILRQKKGGARGKKLNGPSRPGVSVHSGPAARARLVRRQPRRPVSPPPSPPPYDD